MLGGDTEGRHDIAGGKDAADLHPLLVENQLDRRRSGPATPADRLQRLAHLRGGQGDADILMRRNNLRSEEHTSELQSLMPISYAVFCFKKNKTRPHTDTYQ